MISSDEEITIEVLSGPDERGRYSFFIYWLGDYLPDAFIRREMGQVFFTNLSEKIKRLEERGMVIKIIRDNKIYEPKD